MTSIGVRAGSILLASMLVILSFLVHNSSMLQYLPTRGSVSQVVEKTTVASLLPPDNSTFAIDDYDKNETSSLIVNTTTSSDIHTRGFSDIHGIEIPMEDESSMAADILFMVHLPSLQRVLVQLREDAKCRDPYLIGRLSGPALTMLEWTQNGTILEGAYHSPIEGLHYLEVIVLLCNRYENESTNFTNICLENPLIHRITARGTSIVVAAAAAKVDNTSFVGYWSSSSNVPLYTRWQPEGCRRRPRPPFCTVPIDISGFHNYTFTWLRPPIIDPSKQERLCFVGASHSQAIKDFLQDDILLETNSRAFWSGRITFPRFLLPENNEKVKRFIRSEKCTKVVVGIGQWPASFYYGYPMLVDQYRQEMTEALTILKESRYASGRKLFVRSVNPNPLGDEKLLCPPKDWRNPAITEAYNKALKEVCASVGIEFIDTRFILDPMWDNAPDWCHYKNKVGFTQAQYIASVVMNDA